MSFTKIDATDFVVSSDSVVSPAWSNTTTVLQSFFTASSTLTGSYFLDIYNANYTGSNSAIQFSLSYGRSDGLGSAPLNNSVTANTPTRILFGQFRNIIYGDAESAVSFKTGNTSSVDLIAIQIDRNRYKESLMPGMFNLYLSGSGTALIQLTDNSKDVSTVTYLDCGRAFDIVSGSNGTAANSPTLSGAAQGYTVSGSYGTYLPDVGLIVLNPKALQLPSASGGIGLVLASSSLSGSSTNQENIFQAINKGAYFQLNAQETISSNYAFIRIKNQEYNYTTDPSLISGSTGTFIYSNFINSPQTFPTTVGMYNDNNELLAVAKLSQPLVKDFTKEALIRVKLDW